VAAARDKLVVPEIFAFRPRDGTVDLYGALYRPNPALYGPGPYPTVVSVYGGPHVQKVREEEGVGGGGGGVVVGSWSSRYNVVVQVCDVCLP